MEEVTPTTDTNAMRAKIEALLCNGLTVEQVQRGESMADAILALLATDRAGVGEGWKLVPVVPTEAMLDAYWKQTGESKEMRSRTHAYMRRYWSAMLAASPAPADAGGEVEQERMPRDLAYAFVGGLRLSQKRHAAHAMGIKYESNLEGEKVFLHAVEQAGRVHELRVIVAGMLPALKGDALLARVALSTAGAK